MFIQFYIFWNSAILENNLRDLPSPRAPAFQARNNLCCPLERVSLGDVTEIKSVHRGLGTNLVLVLTRKPWERGGILPFFHKLNRVILETYSITEKESSASARFTQFINI